MDEKREIQRQANELHGVCGKVCGVKATCTVTVKPVPVESLELNAYDITIYVGQSYPLQAIITPANASDKRATWSAIGLLYASVDRNGVVTGRLPGTAQVSCRVGGLEATCRVTVEAWPAGLVHEVMRGISSDGIPQGQDGIAYFLSFFFTLLGFVQFLSNLGFSDGAALNYLADLLDYSDSNGLTIFEIFAMITGIANVLLTLGTAVASLMKGLFGILLKAGRLT